VYEVDRQAPVSVNASGSSPSQSSSCVEDASRQLEPCRRPDNTLPEAKLDRTYISQVERPPMVRTGTAAMMGEARGY
jgi:hypothetical protein